MNQSDLFYIYCILCFHNYMLTGPCPFKQITGRIINTWLTATYVKCSVSIYTGYCFHVSVFVSATASPGDYYLFGQLQVCSADLILTLLMLAWSYWPLNFNPSRWDFGQNIFFMTPFSKLITSIGSIIWPGTEHPTKNMT